MGKTIYFPCGTNPVSRTGKIPHLARSGSQLQHDIRFILPAHEASHIISVLKTPLLTQNAIEIEGYKKRLLPTHNHSPERETFKIPLAGVQVERKIDPVRIEHKSAQRIKKPHFC